MVIIVTDLEVIKQAMLEDESVTEEDILDLELFELENEC